MKFEYIEENLNKIMQNLDNVLYLRPYNVGSKRALFAIIKENEGIYKKVQITKELSKLIFPFEPIYWFYNGPGYYFLKNFITIKNWLSLNTSNLDGFKARTVSDNKIFNTQVFATFNDGSATFIIQENAKKFEKQGGIASYIDLLKPFKDYKPQHESYEIMEYHKVNDDLFIIPEIQKNEEHANTRTLRKNETI